MKISPLKRDIVLLIVRDYEVEDIQRLIKAQFNIGFEQAFYIIDNLIEKKLLEFKSGELILTHAAYNILRERRLDVFSLKNIKKYEFIVNEKYLSEYIPEKF